MKKPEKNCLSCKRFHLFDEHSGKCRKDKATLDKSDYPTKRNSDSCDAWLDAGQHYYIRVGWIKKQLET